MGKELGRGEARQSKHAAVREVASGLRCAGGQLGRIWFWGEGKAKFGGFAAQIGQFSLTKLLLIGLGGHMFKRLAMFADGIVDASDFVSRGSQGLLRADAAFEAAIESTQGRIGLNERPSC